MQHLGDILDQLERLAAYDGPWRPLRDETDLLEARLAELRQRETRLDDLLVVALVGGSGVGKSTLLNAIAGDQLAPTSEFRPCTNIPTAPIDLSRSRCSSSHCRDRASAPIKNKGCENGRWMARDRTTPGVRPMD